MTQAAEHARLLRDAIATSRDVTRDDVATATGRSYRTVSNWVSESKPTMPEARDRAILRRILPGYDTAGDPVEVALHRSKLVEWRRDTVLGFYKRHLSEQREGREETA